MESFLEGSEWTLRTRVLRKDTHDVMLTHDAAIKATYDTRAKWNAQFWELFPPEPDRFRAAVVLGEVTVTVVYTFQPTVRIKDRRGDQYERDKRRLEEQRRQAWLELTAMRLPSPPYGYVWELLSGDPRAFNEILNFRLRLK